MVSLPPGYNGALTKTELDEIRLKPVPTNNSGIYINSFTEVPRQTNPKDWYSRAGCRNVDTNLFFTEQAAPAKARNACMNCPVTQECLNYALENRLKGYWGGTGERERERMRANKNRKRQIVKMPDIR